MSDSRRIARQTSKPSIPGSITSRITRSGPVQPMHLDRRRSVVATSVAKPAPSRYSRRSSTMFGASSTTRIVFIGRESSADADARRPMVDGLRCSPTGPTGVSGARPAARASVSADFRRSDGPRTIEARPASSTGLAVPEFHQAGVRARTASASPATSSRAWRSSAFIASRWPWATVTSLPFASAWAIAAASRPSPWFRRSARPRPGRRRGRASTWRVDEDVDPVVGEDLPDVGR